ncbi:MAG: response regulator [Acidobacteriales bacterium]|nr:response regulator [Terriglobales bacterium]
MDPGLYSIEQVAAALITAAGTSHPSADPGSAAEAHLAPLLELLQMNSAVFYAAPDGPLATLPPIEVQTGGRRRVQTPETLAAATHKFIFSQPEQIATSADPAFQMGHLRALPANSAAVSLWASVGNLGTVALFDLATREFVATERMIVRIFCRQLEHALQLQVTPAAVVPLKVTGSADLVKYLESSKIVAVISKDLINPLTAMLGYIELLRGETVSPQAQNYLQKLQIQVEKTQQVVMSIASAANSPHPAMAGIETPAPAPVHTIHEEEPVEERRKRPHPMRRATDQAAAPPLVAAVRSRVLLVQKNEATLEFNRSVLAALGNEVMATFNGSDALQLLQSEDVSAVILDDEIDGEWPGRKLFGWICEHRPELRDRVLLTVSANPRPEIRDWIDEEHMAHVSKPLQMNQMIQGVRDILGKQASKRIH